MAKVLDLNSTHNSILDLTLQDEARTVVHLDFPSESLVRELEVMQSELPALAKGDRHAVGRIYELAAKLINCNLDYFKVTAQELQDTYLKHLVSAITFFSSYLDTINEISNAKN